jgi:hypothetical protein
VHFFTTVDRKKERPWHFAEGVLLDLDDSLDYTLPRAEVAELADARDSKSRSLGSVGSIPTFGTSRL